MFDIIRNILNYHGTMSNIDSTVLNICSYVIPLCFVVVWDLIATFFKQFSKWRD